MRTHAALLVAITLAVGALSEARATPLAATAAVQTKPDPAAPVITTLKAGAEPTPTAQAAEPLPPGWIAVDVPPPVLGYVQNTDFTKGLDVRPGSSIYLEPKAGAGVLATAAKNEKIEIVGLFGDWTQVRIDAPVVGYVQVGPTAATTPPGPAAEAPAGPAPAPLPGPVAAPAAVSAGPAAPLGGAAAESSGLARFLEGTVASTQHAFVPRRPYDWELVDDSGRRIAFLDLSRLVLTEQPESYSGRRVLVYGPVHPTSSGKDLVVDVETLELK